MFNGDNIRDEVFTKYNELVSVLKKKGKLYPSDVQNVMPIVEYFNNNYNDFNKDELKLCKNVFIALEGIKNKMIIGIAKQDIEESNKVKELMTNYIDEYNEKQKESK